MRHEFRANRGDEEQRRDKYGDAQPESGGAESQAHIKQSPVRVADAVDSFTRLRKKYAHSTGSTVRENSNDPISANDIVSAIGRKSRPDGPVSE
jgi:hypothetical protein